MPNTMVQFDLIVDGRYLNDKAKRNLVDLERTREEGKTDELTFSIRASESLILSTTDFLTGMKVQLLLYKGNQAFSVFKGEITDMDINYPEGGAPNIAVTCHDLSWRLKREDETGIYPKASLLDNLKDLLSDNGILTEIRTSRSTDLDKLKLRRDQSLTYGPKQKYKTAWHIISEIGSIIGPNVFVNDDVLFIVGDDYLRSIQDNNLKFERNIQDSDNYILIDCNYNITILRKKGKIDVSGWDFTSKSGYEKKKYLFEPDSLKSIEIIPPEVQPDATAVDLGRTPEPVKKKSQPANPSLDSLDFYEDISYPSIRDIYDDIPSSKAVSTSVNINPDDAKYNESIPVQNSPEIDDLISASGSTRLTKNIQRKKSEKILSFRGKTQCDPLIDARRWCDITNNDRNNFGIDINGEYRIIRSVHRISDDGAYTTIKAVRPLLLHKYAQKLLNTGIVRS